MFNTEKTQETKEVRPNYDGDFTVSNVKVINEKLAKFTLNLCNGTVSLYGCSVVAYKDKYTGADKIFFAPPSQKGSNGDYYKTSYARLSDEMKETIIEAVLAEIAKPKS